MILYSKDAPLNEECRIKVACEKRKKGKGLIDEPSREAIGMCVLRSRVGDGILSRNIYPRPDTVLYRPLCYDRKFAQLSKKTYKKEKLFNKTKLSAPLYKKAE